MNFRILQNPLERTLTLWWFFSAFREKETPKLPNQCWAFYFFQCSIFIILTLMISYSVWSNLVDDIKLRSRSRRTFQWFSQKYCVSCWLSYYLRCGRSVLNSIVIKAAFPDGIQCCQYWRGTSSYLTWVSFTTKTE